MAVGGLYKLANRHNTKNSQKLGRIAGLLFFISHHRENSHASRRLATLGMAPGTCTLPNCTEQHRQCKSAPSSIFNAFKAALNVSTRHYYLNSFLVQQISLRQQIDATNNSKKYHLKHYFKNKQRYSQGNCIGAIGAQG
jgi:hypothetical protein